MTVRHSSENCVEVLSQLNDYVDGELDLALCKDLEQHLAECDDCRVVLDTLEKTVLLVQQLHQAEPELPKEVESRLFAVLKLDDYLSS
ncbi:MAG: hypothetical protein GXP42_15140 [Chloroflexi bacterium]|nr:hypothetical protein [Chloroflexota bacterium]